MPLNCHPLAILGMQASSTIQVVSGVNIMKIIVDPLFPFPTDSVFPCHRDSVIAVYLYLYYITNYYLHHKLHCIDKIFIAVARRSRLG